MLEFEEVLDGHIIKDIRELVKVTEKCKLIVNSYLRIWSNQAI